MPRHGLGDFEQLILLATIRLGDDAYGTAIAEEIEARTNRSVSQAAAYLTLSRLEEKGWISSTVRSGRDGGRARRYYTVGDEGLTRLRESRDELFGMWEGTSFERSA
ncbi:MAG: PadR family transcriptional regulator [Gemmatimonadota bacterium]|nr:PadR family transcriptional regulator [Gemmatimonadota bacterium]